VFTKNEDIRQKARIALDGTAAFCYHRDNINGQAPKNEVRPQAASGPPSFGVRGGAYPRGQKSIPRIVEEERWMYQSKMKSEETDHLFKAILSLKTEEECYRFFDDLCTFSEIEAMSQRFEVASLLADGKTFTQISQKIGVSSTTITRVNKSLCYGADGYRLLLERLKEEQ